MKDKILIGLIIILVLALFVETAYLLQIKYDKVAPQISTKIYSYRPFKRFWQEEETTDPFSEIEMIQEEMNKVFRDGFILNNNLSPSYKDLNPEVDIHETNTHYIVKVNLPNTEKEKIIVEIEDNSLVISEEHNIKHEENNNNGFYRKEQSFGSFRKVIPLPRDVKVSEVTNEYKNGILIIRLPKMHSNNLVKNPNVKIEI